LAAGADAELRIRPAVLRLEGDAALAWQRVAPI